MACLGKSCPEFREMDFDRTTPSSSSIGIAGTTIIAVITISFVVVDMIVVTYAFIITFRIVNNVFRSASLI